MASLYSLPTSAVASSIYLSKNLDTTKDIVVSFDYACYGNNPIGDEGFCVYFIDANAQTILGGSPGPGLTYTPTYGVSAVDTHGVMLTSFNGVNLGQLGIGFDLTGNYGTSAYGLYGYRDGVPNSVSVRGSQNTQYQLFYNSGDLTSVNYPKPISLYQQVTSFDDAQFYTVRVRLTDFCQTLYVDWKLPGDVSYTKYISATIPELWPGTVNCCLGFATGLSGATLAIKDFNVNGFFTTTSAASLVYTWTYTGASYLNQYPNPVTLSVLDTLYIQNAPPWNNYPSLINITHDGGAPLQNTDGYILITNT